MTKLDRYLFYLFSRIFVICFASFAGLYVVIHVFTNLDEVSEISNGIGGFSQLLVSYYVPVLFDLFDKLSGVLTLTSGIFAISLMQRHRETTALASAGISNLRIVRPLLLATIAITSLAVVNREVWLPANRQSLVRSFQNWTAPGVVPMSTFRDESTGVLIRGRELNLQRNQIIDPEFQLPLHLSSEALRFSASHATVESATPRRPDGLLLQNVSVPDDLSDFHSVRDGDEVIVFSPRDFPWLGPRQLYIRSDVKLQDIVDATDLAGYRSLREMVRRGREGTHGFAFGEEVAVHARLLQPFMDMILVLVGLPIVFRRSSQNLFFAAAMCLAVVIGVQLTMAISHALGAYHLIGSPALSAWLPLLVWGPVASITVGWLRTT